jgi:5-hydroxyisourate hydrolase-like protein (transthyretin family)
MKLLHFLMNVLLLAVGIHAANYWDTHACSCKIVGDPDDPKSYCPNPCEITPLATGVADPIPVASNVTAGNTDTDTKVIVKGLVWNEDEGRGEKKVLVKLYRIYSKSKKEKVVSKTKTKADGSYKFIVEGSKSFLKGDFYVRVSKPKGLIFTTVKGKGSFINLLTGRTELFRVKKGTTVSQNAYLQSEVTLEGPQHTKYQEYRDKTCNDCWTAQESLTEP